MLSALRDAISALLEGALADLFTGTKGVKLAYGPTTWVLDPMSADPVAGEPVAVDQVDRVAFDPLAPTGPHLLTQTPYGNTHRVYLRSPAGDLVALTTAELGWTADNRQFTVQPRARRELAGFDQLEIHYNVLAASTRLKTTHETSLGFLAPDATTADQAQALALAALALNHAALRRDAAFSYGSGAYRTEGTLSSLSFSRGSSSSTTSTEITLRAVVDLQVTRFLAETEGTPIRKIRSPGRSAAGKLVDIDPIVQS